MPVSTADRLRTSAERVALCQLQRPLPPRQGVGARPPTPLDQGMCWFGRPRRSCRTGRPGRCGVGSAVRRQDAEIARPRVGTELPTQLSIDVEVVRRLAGRRGDALERCGADAVVDRCGHCVHVRHHFLGRQSVRLRFGDRHCRRREPSVAPGDRCPGIGPARPTVNSCLTMSVGFAEMDQHHRHLPLRDVSRDRPDGRGRSRVVARGAPRTELMDAQAIVAESHPARAIMHRS